jgi:hypothetical protein
LFPPNAGPRARCATVAAVCVALAFTWQCATVRYNYGGNYTGLFGTGSQLPVPPAPDLRGTYVFKGSAGYDGQCYRYLAHDPLFRRGLAKYEDAPRARSGRMLVPALASALALGQPGWTDAAYIAVVLGFLFLGVYWTARWAMLHCRSAAWGLAFAAVPAAIVSLDRMTVDIALAALCCGWAVYASGKTPDWRVYAVLMAIPLARETGLIVNAASAIPAIAARSFRRIALLAATVIPFAAWYAWVRLNTPPEGVGMWFANAPLAGLAQALLRGAAEPGALPARLVIAGLDYTALAGMALALALAAILWWRNPRGAFEAALAGFALLAIQVGRADVWVHVFSYGRVFSPLLVLLGLRALAGRNPALALPLLLVLPRVLLQLGSQVLGVARGIAG